MQFDSLRAFPYPVLRPDVDDYVDGDMQVTVEFSPSEDGLEVTATGEFHVSVKELLDQIAGGNARFTIVFACRDTYYRYVHSSKEGQFSINFPAGKLRGEVQIFPYIAAVKKISNYHCPWINPEFGNGPFSYETGAVLAVERPQVVFIDRDVFRPLSSLFVLTKDDSIVGHEWQVKATDDKVHIAVSADLKDRIDKARNNKGHRAVLMNSIYFSAVMQCLSLLKHSSESDSTRWGRIIREKCHNEGINLENHDEYLLAERLMKSPFKLVEAYVFQGSDQ